MIDLSSDTATRPTSEMREAVARAEVGDEQRLEDPTVSRLIAEVCEKLGKEAGLFLPSGTMCNLVALKTHTHMGDACFLGHNSHILRCETGAASAVCGLVLDTVDSEDGRFTAESLEKALYTRSPYTPNPALVCVEQTHNFAGGAVWPLLELRKIKQLSEERGLRVHMDGARLFNAAVASGISVAEYGTTCDSLWVDFTKGLGAPLGAVLCGSQEFIERARIHKHMFGGALRQAGMMAAACLYALHHHVERLAEDHARAARLADTLRSLPEFVVRPVDTNLIFFKPGKLPPVEFAALLEKRGVRISYVGEWARAVTHLDVNDDDISKAITTLEEMYSPIGL